MTTKKKTPKQEATERAKEWAGEFAQDTEVAVVQSDMTRKIATIAGAPKLDVELDARVPIVYHDQAAPDVVSASRIRKRAINTKKTTNPLRVLLTDKEKLGLGAGVADGLATVGSLEAELATVKKQYQGKIQEAQAGVASKSELLRNGYEIRQVACLLIQDFDTGTAIEKRVDTCEQVESRNLRKEERERELLLFPELNQEATAETAAANEGATETSTDGGNLSATEPTEDEIAQAIELVRETHRASLTSFQRKLGVGLLHSGRIMDVLESRGIVGPATGPTATREVIEEDVKAEDAND